MHTQFRSAPMNSYNNQQTVMQRDFKLSKDMPKLRSARLHWAGLAGGLVLFGATIFLFTDRDASATRNPATTLPEATLSGQQLTLPLDLPGGESLGSADVQLPAEPSEEATSQWQIETVRSGDNLALMFARLGLSARELDQLIRSGDATATFKRLMPGQQLKFAIADGKLQKLDYEIDALNTLQVRRNGDDFRLHSVVRELETRHANTSAIIDSSLFLAGQAAGMSDTLIMELAGIFGWDIDFALDIRKGDRFTLVYEEQYLDGKKLGDGNILAAEFVNRGNAYRAVRYTDAQGHADYYSPDGKSMRKAFIRTPVDFTRISSRFGARYHPTLKEMRNHHGVDYAAPIGTPIKAAGDGKVIFVGRKGGYGKVVIIQHGSTYSTLYAHMSRFKPGLRRGKQVRQGQTIGYVGSTGRSTGPHLHYEFRVNGVHRNPLTVKLPDAAPIQARYRSDFIAKTRPLVALLETLDRTTLALNTSGQ